MECDDYGVVTSDCAGGAVWGFSAGMGVLGQKRKGMYRLFWSKLSVTGLLVHHFFPRSNYSRFHVVTLLCPPWCTITVMYNRTEIQGPGVKAGKNCCWNVTSVGFVFVLFLHRRLTLSCIQWNKELLCFSVSAKSCILACIVLNSVASIIMIP